MNSESHQTKAREPVLTTSDPACDRTLIVEMLRLTPEERLEWHARALRAVLELRRAVRS